MSRIYRIKEMTDADFACVAADIEAGAVAVYPTDTVYGIGTNAFDEQAISRLYEIKQRPASSALQILVETAAQAQQIVQWNGHAEKLARAFWPGALTLILSPNAQGQALRRGFAGLGLRVPAHERLKRLLALMKCPLASTSANLHAYPVITREEEVVGFFDGKADLLLLDGVLSNTASSVLDLTAAEPVLLREAAISRVQLEKTLEFPLK